MEDKFKEYMDSKFGHTFNIHDSEYILAHLENKDREREELKNKLFKESLYSIALWDMGVYPAAVTENGVTKDRDEFGNGYNKYAEELISKKIKLSKWRKTVTPEIRDLIMSKRLNVYIDDDEISLYVNCNDLFFWGCADCEDFELKELPDLQRAIKESRNNGDILWVCRKRGMRPQGPYYKYFNEQEVELFNACGQKETRHKNKEEICILYSFKIIES